MLCQLSVSVYYFPFQRLFLRLSMYFPSFLFFFLLNCYEAYTYLLNQSITPLALHWLYYCFLSWKPTHALCLYTRVRVSIWLEYWVCFKTLVFLTTVYSILHTPLSVVCKVCTLLLFPSSLGWRIRQEWKWIEVLYFTNPSQATPCQGQGKARRGKLANLELETYTDFMTRERKEKRKKKTDRP